MFCPKCGTENEEDSAFCKKCGYALKVAQTQTGPTSQQVYNKPANQQMNAKGTNYLPYIIGAIILVVVLVYGFGGLKQTFQGALPPSVQVTSYNGRTGFVGLDATAYIDVSVNNSGGRGTVVVWAKFTQGANSWTKSQSVTLEAQQSSNLTFEFMEYELLGGQAQYTVWVTS